jgi:hypothetical protein
MDFVIENFMPVDYDVEVKTSEADQAESQLEEPTFGENNILASQAIEVVDESTAEVMVNTVRPAAATPAAHVSTPAPPMDEIAIRREHALNELKALITSTLASKMEEMKNGLTHRMLGHEVFE